MEHILEKLIITDNIGKYEGILVESCGNFQEELQDYFIFCTNENIKPLQEYIEESVVNSEYLLNMFKTNPVKSFELLAAVQGVTSWTQAFIDYFDGLERLQKFLRGEPLEEFTEAEEPAEEYVPTDFIDEDFEDDVEESEEAEEETGEVVENLDSQEVVENETETEDTPTAQNVNVIPQELVQLSSEDSAEMLLILRCIAQKLGLAEFTSDQTLEPADLVVARKYVATFSAQTIKEVFESVILSAATKEELRAVTKVLEMFIKYVEDNNVVR